MAITNVKIPNNEKSNPRLRLKSPPTDDTLRQWAQTTRHIPGTLGMGACGGPEGAKLMTLLQLGRGHAILTLVFLQINRQLHGHRTYLRPGGAFLMGVASLQEGHFTTCCSRFPEMSIIPWQTRHVT